MAPRQPGTIHAIETGYTEYKCTSGELSRVLVFAAMRVASEDQDSKAKALGKEERKPRYKVMVMPNKLIPGKEGWDFVKGKSCPNTGWYNLLNLLYGAGCADSPLWIEAKPELQRFIEQNWDQPDFIKDCAESINNSTIRIQFGEGHRVEHASPTGVELYPTEEEEELLKSIVEREIASYHVQAKAGSRGAAAKARARKLKAKYLRQDHKDAKQAVATLLQSSGPGEIDLDDDDECIRIANKLLEDL